MTDPLTAMGLVALAFAQQAMQSELGKKFVESTIGKLAEKLTEAGLKKAIDLRQMIANRLKGKSKNTDMALAAAEEGSGLGLEEVAKQLQAEMKHDPQFASSVRKLAEEIHQEIVQMDSVNAQNAMQVSDGEGFLNADSFQITNSTISLGGEGGRAPGAGGGGGGAIGSQSHGGKGGDGGGHFFLSATGKRQQLNNLHTPKWAREFIESIRPLLNNPGAGGAGQGAIGPESRGGDGGHGGGSAVGRLYLEPGLYRVEVGEGGKPSTLPGQHSFHGTGSRIIAPDGTVVADIEGGRGTRSASSYLPNGVRELSAADVEAGFKIVVLAPCNNLEIRDGLMFADGLGWQYYLVSSIPIEGIWIVACSVQLSTARDQIGFYVALLDPSNKEVACQAITLPLEKENLTWHFRIPLGALFDKEGTWKLVAYSGEYLLADYAVNVCLQESLSG